MNCKAAILVRYGRPDKAFEIREIAVNAPKAGEIQIESEAFGLNYADVMARLGMYREAPPLPALIGYETVGKVISVGEGVEKSWIGKRVMAFCRFRGYAAIVNTPLPAAMEIPTDWNAGKALALVTQYSTAWYASMIATTIREGEWVLINSAAGGVGTALLQIALWRKCKVIATSRSEEKLALLRKSGAHAAINYLNPGFTGEVKKVSGGIDVAFDAVGGLTFKRSWRALVPTGRMVGFGAASRSDIHFLPKLRMAFQFGFMHPALLMMSSRSMIGVNMLRVSERQPHLLRESLCKVSELTSQGILDPKIGKEFSRDQIAEAHSWLGSGQSTGKVFVSWNK